MEYYTFIINSLDFIMKMKIVAVAIVIEIFIKILEEVET